MNNIMLIKCYFFGGIVFVFFVVVLVVCNGKDDNKESVVKDLNLGIDKIMIVFILDVLKLDVMVDVVKLMVFGLFLEMLIGKVDVLVIIVEYMLMICLYCVCFQKDIFLVIKIKYVDIGKVCYILCEFLFDLVVVVVIMLVCCVLLEQYFFFVDVFFQQQMSWVVVDDKCVLLMQMFKFVGFIQESFNVCLMNQKFLDDVNVVCEKGVKDFGVNVMLIFFVNGVCYVGEMMVDQMLVIIDSKF